VTVEIFSITDLEFVQISLLLLPNIPNFAKLGNSEIIMVMVLYGLSVPQIIKNKFIGDPVSAFC